MKNKTYEKAFESFHRLLSSPDTKQEVREIILNRDTVINRYKPIFSFENIHLLTEEQFRSFLYFENNRHWSGLYRQGIAVCSDMEILRSALSTLLNPSKPIANRFDESLSKIKGFGKALATAILLMSSPDEYGVWNNTSERALRQLGLWHDFVRGGTLGQQYEQINSLLLRLARDLGIDLWTLDALMWGVLPEDDEDTHPVVHATPDENETKKPEIPLYLNEIQHPDLKARLIKLISAPLDTIIREAGVVFENHLRNKIDPDSAKHGVELVDDALKPGGKLIFSSHPGEQQGVQFLYRGAMQFIRNPPMHKIIDYPESMAQQFLRLIDSLLMLLDDAATAGEITIDDIRFMLRRKFIRQNQMELFRALKSARSNGMEFKQLAEAMQLTPQQLSGVLGSLGSRINNTEGLEDKGGILLIFDIKQTKTGEWLYIMRPILEKALEEEGIL